MEGNQEFMARNAWEELDQQFNMFLHGQFELTTEKAKDHEASQECLKHGDLKRGTKNCNHRYAVPSLKYERQNQQRIPHYR